MAETGSSLIASAQAKFGPLSGTLGAELDDSGCLTVTPEAALGPIKVTATSAATSHEIELETRGGITSVLNSGRASAQGKLAARLCHRY